MGIRVFCGGVKGVGVVGKDLALRESPPLVWKQTRKQPEYLALVHYFSWGSKCFIMLHNVT